MAHVRTAIPNPDDPVHCLNKYCTWSGVFSEVFGQVNALAACPKCGHVVARGHRVVEPLTPDEFSSRMHDIAGLVGDIEDAHREATRLLCHVLRSLGYGTGVDIYVNMRQY